MLQIFFFTFFSRIYNNEVHYTDSVSVHIQHIKIRRLYISFFFPLLIECKSDASRVNKVNCCSQFHVHTSPIPPIKKKKEKKINIRTQNLIYK